MSVNQLTLDESELNLFNIAHAESNAHTDGHGVFYVVTLIDTRLFTFLIFLS